MENFFEQFRRNWHSRPAPEWEENDWLALQNRLKAPPAKKRVLPVLWWITLPFLLASASVNWMIFKELKEKKQYVSFLETRRDTVYVTRFIYETDTVYRTRIWRDRFVNRLPVAAGQPADSLVFPSKSAPSVFREITEVGPKDPPGANSFPIAPIHSLSIHPLSAPDRPLELLKNVPLYVSGRGKNIRRYLHDFQPAGASVTLRSGLAYPLPPFSPAQAGWSVGMQAALRFSDKWNIWGEGQFIKAQYRSGQMDESLGIPAVDPPADDFVFQEADAPMPVWLFAMGLERRFPGKRRHMEPFVGLGYGFGGRLPYEISYDFVRPADGVEWTIDQNASTNRSVHGLALGRAGVSVPVFGQWRFELSVSGVFQTNRKTERFPSLLQLQGGLQRNF